ncbi:MAG: tRNA (guanosine(46)-N7)-methyltransferase TrmB [Cyanobacteria bacterium CAN_BIN43]|nr:tRNA (guanosine(46)-N7)-methyltransferase TrmB [Cyanobacteria bacterium CAN_BIN43]
MSIVRVRQHVNPLSGKYKQPVTPPDWSKVYARQQPLHLDIGCARGNFMLGMAQLRPEENFLGIEIRETLVSQANVVRAELGLTNLHFLFCNANTSLQPLLESLLPNTLHCATIQFPDPWFKKRHQKRRVVQPQVVEMLAHYLIPGGAVMLQSDVEEVEVDMCDRFQAHPSFTRTDSNWLATNPFPVPTEREQFTLDKGQPVYRAVFEKMTRS